MTLLSTCKREETDFVTNFHFQGQPRGYLTMRRKLHTGNPTILFKISSNLNLTLPSKLSSEVMDVLQQWQNWLTMPCQDRVEKKEFLLILVSKFLSLWCSECSPGIS